MTSQATAVSPTGAASADAVPQLPLAFVRNEGQWAEEIQFVARRGPMTAQLHSDRIRFLLPADKESEISGLSMALRFNTDGKARELKGENPSTAQFNFLVGNNQDRWRSGVTGYAAVRYAELYAGVDMLVHDGAKGLQYDLEFQPGADSSKIAIECEGVDSLAIDSQGQLVMHTRIGAMIQTPPIAWQVAAEGARTPVACAFRLLGETSYGFVTADLDPNLGLVIDPQVDYASYFGGSSDQVFNSMVVDSQGFIYISGGTSSTDLPVTTHLPSTISTGAYVAKLDPDAAPGKSLKWLTIFGGSGSDSGWSLALHQNEATVYVGGRTTSTDFPSFNAGMGGPLLTHPGTESGYVMALDTMTGGNFLYSVFLGTRVRALTIDNVGNAWCCGFQSSELLTSVGGDPVTNIHGQLGGDDAFVAVLNPTGTSVLKSALIGGLGTDVARDLVINGTSHVYLVGWSEHDTTMTTGLFPTTTNQLKAPFDGGSDGIDTDGFLVRLNPALTDLQYSTLVGGRKGKPNRSAASKDLLYGVAIHETVNEELVVLVGETTATDFPLLNPLVDASNDLHGDENRGLNDICVSVLDFATFAMGQDPTLRMSSFIGGWLEDGASDVEFDSDGNIYLFGFCDATLLKRPTAHNFPRIGSPILQPDSGDFNDTFLAILTPVGGAYAMPYCSPAGGNGNDSSSGLAVQDMALGPDNTIHFGFTTSSTDLVTTANAMQSSVTGSRSVYLRRMASPVGPPPPGITVNPTAGLVTTEGGGTDTFSVVLDTQPSVSVRIDISSSDTTEGTVSPTILVFDGSNWDQPQTVTVTGFDDGELDPDVAYTLITAPAISGDTDYSGINAADVSATNLNIQGGTTLSVNSFAPASMNAGSTVAMTINGTGFAAGASVSFENGSGPKPTAANVVVTSSTITADVSVSGGGKRGTRQFTLRVTNSDGGTATAPDAFLVIK